MADSLLEEFETFFTELPPPVRSDLWFMMVMMSDENLVFDDPAEACERKAPGLFQAQTATGRIGDMVYAASIFDIYFAMNTDERFGTDNEAQANPLTRYADQTAAVGRSVATLAGHKVCAGSHRGGADASGTQLRHAPFRRQRRPCSALLATSRRRNPSASA